VSLPRPVSEALLRFGVPADTIAWADDLYKHLGPQVVDALGELVESRGLQASELRPADLDAVRPLLGERYLRQQHAAWKSGASSPAFWCDRSVEASARGLVSPLGDLEAPASPLLRRIAEAARTAAGEDQPDPRGLMLLSSNAHRGNQSGTFAVDLVPSMLDDALALNAASGRHHTLPGSIGETSGRALADPPLAIVWEVQPNVYKPSQERNRAASKPYRRHRLWALATSIGALAWLIERGYRVFVLNGEALRAAHEVNPEEPLSPEIERLHDLTMERAARALGHDLRERASADVPAELALLAKVRLGDAFAQRGAHKLVRELVA